MADENVNRTMLVVGEAVMKYGIDVLFYVTKTGKYANDSRNS